LNNQWPDEESRRRPAEVEGFPAVYCHHLSQGWAREEVQACLAEVKRIVNADRERAA